MEYDLKIENTYEYKKNITLAMRINKTNSKNNVHTDS